MDGKQSGYVSNQCSWTLSPYTKHLCLRPVYFSNLWFPQFGPTRPESRPQTKSSEVTPASRPRTPRICEELERRFRNLELRQKDWIEQTRTRGELEYLAVAKSGTGQYLITVKGTGKPFVRETFVSAEFCLECAVEIEESFEIVQVVELRPPETIERIEEMIGVWLDRERVARVLGQLGQGLS